MKCKRCNCENIIKYGKRDNKQCYLCKVCNHQFVSESGRHTDQEEHLAAMLYCFGLTFKQIGEILHINASTAMRWVKRCHNRKITLNLEEMRDFISTKNINITP